MAERRRSPYLEEFAAFFQCELFDGTATYEGLQLGSTEQWICPSETVTDTPMSSTVLGSGAFDYQLQFVASSGGTPGSMSLIVAVVAEPQTLLFSVPLAATFLGLGLAVPLAIERKETAVYVRADRF